MVGLVTTAVSGTETAGIVAITGLNYLLAILVQGVVSLPSNVFEYCILSLERLSWLSAFNSVSFANRG